MAAVNLTPCIIPDTCVLCVCVCVCVDVEIYFITSNVEMCCQLFAQLKSQDIGRMFRKQTKRVEKVEFHAGSTPTAEAQHFVRDSERIAFSNWINRLCVDARMLHGMWHPHHHHIRKLVLLAAVTVSMLCLLAYLSRSLITGLVASCCVTEVFVL